jgi:glycosyltransferase involved in cell wall biosynthesis
MNHHQPSKQEFNLAQTSVQSHPLVTIVLPVRNEEQYIQRSLDAVLKQDYPVDRIEILVIDGMSDDRTRPIIEQTIAKNPSHRIQLLDNPEQIFSTGFNRGLLQAQGTVIVMLGGHTELAPDYLRHCIERLSGHAIDCVGGPIETVAETPMSETIAVAMSSSFGVGGVAFRTAPNRSMEVDTVAFGAYKRSSMERCGFLDEEMVRNQDDEYNYRLRKVGGRILLAPEIHSRYYNRSSLASLWKQYFQYGYWKVRVLQKHPLQMHPRHFAPFIFVTSLLVSALMTPFFQWGLALFMLVSGTYLAANLAATVHTCARRGWNHLILLPLVYAILHISYGLGFLIGMVRFACRWEGKVFRRPIWSVTSDSSEKGDSV